jgi:hypothetical protein
LGKLLNNKFIIISTRLRTSSGNAYNKTKSFLGTVDSGINNLKTIYSVVSPIMESYGVNPANKTVMKALTGYDTIKSHVMENHDK